MTAIISRHAKKGIVQRSVACRMENESFKTCDKSAICIRIQGFIIKLQNRSPRKEAQKLNKKQNCSITSILQWHWCNIISIQQLVKLTVEIESVCINLI